MCLTRTCVTRTLEAMELRAWLASKGKKPTAFAKEIGKSHSTVLRLLSGDAAPSADMVRDIFKATGGKVTANDLFKHPSAVANDATPQQASV